MNASGRMGFRVDIFVVFVSLFLLLLGAFINASGGRFRVGFFCCFCQFVFIVIESIYECLEGEGCKSGCCGVVGLHMFGEVLGRVRSSGVSSFPVRVIEINLENSSICLLTTS